MTEFLNIVKRALGISEGRNSRNCKRRLPSEDNGNSGKFRKLSFGKMSDTNAEWGDVPTSNTYSFLNHRSTHPRVSTIVEVSDDEDGDPDLVEVRIIRKSASTPQNSTLTRRGWNSSSSPAPTTRTLFQKPPVPPLNYVSTRNNELFLKARRTIDRCQRVLKFDSRQYSCNGPNESYRLDEKKIYQEMLLSSQKETEDYSKGYSAFAGSRLASFFNHRPKAPSSLSFTIDLTNTDEPSASAQSQTSQSPIDTGEDKKKRNDLCRTKDDSSETSSNASKTKSCLLKAYLDRKPCMDPNLTRKICSLEVQNETERIIDFEKKKLLLYREASLTNIEVALHNRLKDCKISTVLFGEEEYDATQDRLVLPKLSDDQEARILAALKSRHPSRVYAEKFNLRITGSDLKTFNEKEWLNDEVINFYVNLIQERSLADGLPKVHAFSTFFYPKLINSGYSSLRRWTKKVDIFAVDIIVVPIHLAFHWCMAIIDFRDKSIRYYDSMLGKNKQCLDALDNYLHAEHKDKKKFDYDTSDWKKINMDKIPKQMNGSDCGVFSCTFAEFITRNAKILFTQEHMPYLRRKMTLEILDGRLLT